MKRLDEILEFLFHTKRGILTLVLGGMSSAMLFGGCFVTDCFACACEDSCGDGWIEIDDCINDCVSCDGSCDNTLCTGLFGAGCVTDCGDNECGLSCNMSDWDCANDCDDGDCNWSCGGFSCANGIFRSDYVEPYVSINVYYYNISTGDLLSAAGSSQRIYDSATSMSISYDTTYYSCVGVYSSTSTSSTQIADSNGIFSGKTTGEDFTNGQSVYVLLEEKYYGELVTFTFSATVDGEDISTNSDFDKVTISGSLRIKVGYAISGMPDHPDVTGYDFIGWYLGDTDVSSYLVDGKILHLYDLGTTSTSLNIVAKYSMQTISGYISIDESSYVYNDGSGVYHIGGYTVKSGTTIGELLEKYNIKEDINTNYGRYLGVAYSSSASEYLSEDTVIDGSTIYIIYDKYVSITIYNADGPNSGSEVITGYCVGDTLTLSTENISGYYFAGWYYDSSYSSYVEDYSIVLKDKDYAYYVKWANKAQVRVEYYSDSTLSTLVNLVYYNQSSSSSTSLWTGYSVDIGYKLDGWCRSGTSTVITSLPSGSADTIQLYASISAKTYTVYLDANGGTVSSSYAYVTYGETGYYIEPPAARDGYTFLGWYYGNTKVTDADGDALYAFTASVFGTTALSGDTLTLTAKWESEKIYVYYYVDTTCVHTDSYEYADLTYASLWTDVSSYVPVGYTFNGWKDSAGYTVTELWATTDDIYLSADLTAKTYTIILDANGGTINSQTSYSITLAYGDGYFLDIPVRDGYTFAGWYYGSTKVTDEYGDSLGDFTSDALGSSAFANDTLTFSARWMANSAAAQGVEAVSNNYAVAAVKIEEEDK